MKRSLTKAGLRLNELKLAGAIQLITCLRQRSSRAGPTFQSSCRRRNCLLHRRANSAVDALARQHEQWSQSQFDCHPDSDRHHRQYASDNFSTRPFEAACEVAL